MSPSKLRQEKRVNYFTSILYRMVIKIKRLNSYKSAHNTLKTNREETQKLFQRHYMQDDHECKDVKYL